MTEHVCLSCARVRPDCGHVRQVCEGFCRDWTDSSKQTEMEFAKFMTKKEFVEMEKKVAKTKPSDVMFNLTKETGEPK